MNHNYTEYQIHRSNIPAEIPSSFYSVAYPFLSVMIRTKSSLYSLESTEWLLCWTASDWQDTHDPVMLGYIELTCCRVWVTMLGKMDRPCSLQCCCHFIHQQCSSLWKHSGDGRSCWYMSTTWENLLQQGEWQVQMEQWTFQSKQFTGVCWTMNPAYSSWHLCSYWRICSISSPQTPQIELLLMTALLSISPPLN